MHYIADKSVVIARHATQVVLDVRGQGVGMSSPVIYSLMSTGCYVSC